MFSLRPQHETCGPQIRHKENLGVWFKPELPISLRKTHSWAIIKIKKLFCHFWNVHLSALLVSVIVNITEGFWAVERDTVTTRPFTSTDIFLFQRETFIFLSELKLVTFYSFCWAQTIKRTKHYIFLTALPGLTSVNFMTQQNSRLFESTDWTNSSLEN